MNSRLVYEEKLSSPRTETLFVILAILFFLLFGWRAATTGSGLLTLTFLTLSGFFVFYALNYRTLRIGLTREALTLKFGIFTWTIPLENIERCFLDETSMWRIGGAGIHFSPIGGRYRAMLNFLEHPRVVVALKRPQGPVRDVAFSTRQPAEVIRLIDAEIGDNTPA